MFTGVEYVILPVFTKDVILPVFTEDVRLHVFTDVRLCVFTGMSDFVCLQRMSDFLRLERANKYS